ncbi:formate--tetrahydrofolate ligase [Thermosipho ferrireducens]|uniref:Formate--tetrahydrofolate ligase n=1 Tax=Thermosipho ferrireducens TaxID=2571116 RepID=A0ABX7S7E9_9BACT|nr:formate--tetrahydrofolate ligase [Thermosipho ferrireducens]QTA37188.1 formate--tetrahydrofolate ligase [Thermosipho ferrireducens]
MKSDIEIAHEAKLKKISEIADSLNIPEKYVEPYGKYIAKIDHKILDTLKNKNDGKLILVTAITPTPAGEGKTTTSIGLSMALNKLGKNSIVTLREPSLGPVFGIKGGAAGGGYSQVLPMENINLHFTGDIHAVTAAHNLLSAVIDAHIKFGNELKIDPTKVYWKRAIDMNDRALRNIVIALGGSANGHPREEGFIITAASEIMAILCLAKDLKDLKKKISNIVVAQTYDKKLVKVKDLNVQGAMAALLKDAINPNLVQTIENTPAFIHGGPFANIAHGTNSIIATKIALKLSDYVVTEAGFAADLGAEKFLDFVSPIAGFNVNAVVLVATIKALKYHGGVKKDELSKENVEAMLKGMGNLFVHYENLKKYNVPVIVALNVFDTDTEKELNQFSKYCKVPHAFVRAFEKGSKGAEELAKLIIENAKENCATPLINSNMSIKEKIEILAKEIYRAGNVIYTDKAKAKLKFLEKHGYSNLPVIVAKTQASISDDPKKLNAPSDYAFTIRDFELSAGAGFVVALAGDIMRMPGLSRIPNAVNIDIDDDGNIVGLS